MSVIDDDEREVAAFPGQRPPRASVGSHRIEEEVFGKAYDPKTVRRIWAFVRPYRHKIYLSVLAVLIFTATQLAIPLIIGWAIDGGMVAGGDPSTLLWAVLAFAIAVLFNFGASYVQEMQVGQVAENVLFDMRRAMFAQLQRVSLSFMDKTEVGRLMSRLQGDVNSMQEFLETSVVSVGDIVLLGGIVVVLLSLDPWLGLLTLVTMPVLFVVRIFWLPPAKRAFWAAHDPTQLNRQGNDIGTQYRSAIFYHNEEQRRKAEEYKQRLNAEQVYDQPIVTEITPFTAFYRAEDYHHDYFSRNGNEPYCAMVVRPKVEKFKKVFQDKLKNPGK